MDKSFLCRHGVGRTDFNLFSDESLGFKGILDGLALQLKKRKQEQLAKQNQNKGTSLWTAFTRLVKGSFLYRRETGSSHGHRKAVVRLKHSQ